MIKINLLPFRAARKKENIRRQISVAVLLVFATAMIILWSHFTIMARVEEKNKDAAEMKTRIEELQVSVKEVNKFKKKKEELEKKLEVINSLEKSRKGPLNLLVKLSDCIPDKAWLTKFTQKGLGITMEGVALDNETISLFLQSMEKKQYFTNVELESTSQVVQKGKVYQKFKLKCKENPETTAR